MALLNYTTKVSASKTVGEMQSMLAKAGATSVSAVYESGVAVGLAFSIDTPHGSRSFSLPMDARPVEKILREQTKDSRYHSPEQAERTAWRILKDWLEAQLAIIETQMVTLDQVMLPYLTDVTGKTLYDLYVDRQLALPSPTS